MQKLKTDVPERVNSNHGVMKGKGSNFNGQKAMFIFFKSSITL
jgi:hypothetical protein